MQFVLLRGRFSHRVFGFQVHVGRLVFQFADGRLGVYDQVLHRWYL